MKWHVWLMNNQSSKITPVQRNWIYIFNEFIRHIRVAINFVFFALFLTWKVRLAFANCFSGCWVLRFGYFLFIVCTPYTHAHIPLEKKYMEWKLYIHNSIRGRFLWLSVVVLVVYGMSMFAMYFYHDSVKCGHNDGRQNASLDQNSYNHNNNKNERKNC